MQATHDEDHEGSHAGRAERAQGLQQNPHGVTQLLINGWEADAGSTAELTISNEAVDLEYSSQRFAEKRMEFIRIHIPFLRLYNNAHMLFIQGMGVGQVFLASELVLPGGKKLEGPFIYICGAIREMWKVPFGIDDLVLAKIIKVPDDKMPLEVANVFIFNHEFARRKK